MVGRVHLEGVKGGGQGEGNFGIKGGGVGEPQLASIVKLALHPSTMIERELGDQLETVQLRSGSLAIPRSLEAGLDARREALVKGGRQDGALVKRMQGGLIMQDVVAQGERIVIQQSGRLLGNTLVHHGHGRQLRLCAKNKAIVT